MKYFYIKNTKSGFITKIIILIVALVALKYAFHFDIVEYYKSAQIQGYIHTVENWIKNIYTWIDTTVNHYLGKK